MDEKTLQRAQEVLGHNFNDTSLLFRAFSHSSQADNRLDSNERLEFFGDSVLSVIICQTLFEQFPEYLEGDLTKIKSMMVSRKTCAKVANNLGLVELVKVGKGMSATRAMSGSIAAGTLEAVIAALYLDGGFEVARKFVVSAFEELIREADAQQHQENFKSLLQQHCQQNFETTPTYELLDEKGPDHNKCFEVGVVIGARRCKTAWGITKKEAEQKAAKNALIELEVIQEKH